MNYWVIAFPCVIYIASVGMQSSSPPTDNLANVTETAMGIMFIYYQDTSPTTVLRAPIADSFRFPFFTISPGLNILLTIVIVTRLIWHPKNIRSAMGASAGATG